MIWLSGVNPTLNFVANWCETMLQNFVSSQVKTCQNKQHKPLQTSKYFPNLSFAPQKDPSLDSTWRIKTMKCCFNAPFVMSCNPAIGTRCKIRRQQQRREQERQGQQLLVDAHSSIFIQSFCVVLITLLVIQESPSNCQWYSKWHSILPFVSIHKHFFVQQLLPCKSRVFCPSCWQLSSRDRHQPMTAKQRGFSHKTDSSPPTNHWPQLDN